MMVERLRAGSPVLTEGIGDLSQKAEPTVDSNSDSDESVIFLPADSPDEDYHEVIGISSG